MLEEIFGIITFTNQGLGRDNCRMAKAKVVEVVWYVVGNTREQAKIIAISGSTQATIRVLTGPQRDQEFPAPWGIIEPLEK